MNHLGSRWRVVKTVAIVGLVVLLVSINNQPKTLAAALLRNLGQREAMLQFARPSQDCNAKPLQAADKYLERAVLMQPQVLSSWRALLKVRGLTDRSWIQHRFGSRQSDPVLFDEVIRAITAFPPSQWMIDADWSRFRCLAAWDAWTAGLLSAAAERWEDSVSFYQTGFAFALGRVPASIMREYYWALGHFVLSARPTARKQLAAAKYLSLAGADQQANDLFRILVRDEFLTPEQRCEAAAGIAWLQGDPQIGRGVPHWPVGIGEQDDTCLPVEKLIVGADRSKNAEWQLKPPNSVVDSESGARLLSFDVDHDVLDAGVEIVGTAYWQRADGIVERRYFRRPNLWPNGGNAWLPAQGDSRSDLPGFTEPGWSAHSASAVVDPAGVRRNPVGQIVVQRDEDAFITTSEALVPSGATTIVGGWWWVNGDFPWPHVAREMMGIPAYEIMMDLRATAGGWQAIARALPSRTESVIRRNLVRPQSGSGQLLFDDVFLFTLPGTQYLP